LNTKTRRNKAAFSPERGAYSMPANSDSHSHEH